MKALLFTAGGAVALGALYVSFPDGSPQALGKDRFDETAFEVRRGDLPIVIEENGYLNAENSVGLKPKYRGQNMITFLIDEGTEVEEGDVLVEFDATELEAKLEEAENTLIQYETELEAAQANLEIQKRDNLADVEKAQLTLDVARLTLKRYEDGEYPTTLRQKELAVEKARSEFQRLEESFQQVPDLVAEGFMTRIQAEEERIRLREAEINEENAEKDLELYERYTRPMELRQKEADVTNAERALESTKEKAEINLKEKQAQGTQKDRLVKSTKSLIERTKKDLENMKMIAPQPGIVIHGDPKNDWQRDQIKMGANVWQGLTVITLPDLSEMQVLVEIHEADINLIEKGQKAVITLDTYKGQVFSGEVADVANVATSSWRDSTNKQFRVEIAMDPTELELRSGITAKVEIEIGMLEDVLHVPIQAVFHEGEEYFCFIPDGGGFRRRAVEIGRNNAHYVAIESGLEEGEQVLLVDPREEGLAEDAREGEPEEGGTPADGLGVEE